MKKKRKKREKKNSINISELSPPKNNKTVKKLLSFRVPEFLLLQ